MRDSYRQRSCRGICGCVGGIPYQRYLYWYGGVKPLWIRWSDEKHAELKAVLDEIDLEKFGKAHLFNLSAAIAVVIGVAKDLGDFAETVIGAELNLTGKWLKLYAKSEGLDYILKHDGNRRKLSDAEMTAVMDTAFGLPYRKKDGTIWQGNQKTQSN